MNFSERKQKGSFGPSSNNFAAVNNLQEKEWLGKFIYILTVFSVLHNFHGIFFLVYVLHPCALIPNLLIPLHSNFFSFFFLLPFEICEKKIILWAFLCLFLLKCHCCLLSFSVLQFLQGLGESFTSSIAFCETAKSVELFLWQFLLKAVPLPCSPERGAIFYPRLSQATVCSLQDLLISLLQKMSSDEKKSKPLFTIPAFLRVPHICVVWRRFRLLG